jgi:hypothetical protein
MDNPHEHTSTPPLSAPWCAQCSALLDQAVEETEWQDAVFWQWYYALLGAAKETE